MGIRSLVTLHPRALHLPCKPCWFSSSRIVILLLSPPLLLLPSLYSYRSFSDQHPFLSRSHSLEPLPSLLRFDYLRLPRRYPLAFVLGHCLLLGPYTPFPLVLEAMHLWRTLTSSLRLASRSVGERTLTSSSRPVPPRHCLLRLVLLLLFLPLLTPPGINQPRRVPFRSRPSSKYLDKLRAKKLIAGLKSEHVHRKYVYVGRISEF